MRTRPWPIRHAGMMEEATEHLYVDFVSDGDQSGGHSSLATARTDLRTGGCVTRIAHYQFPFELTITPRIRAVR